MAPPLQPQGRQACNTTIQSRLVSGARAGCKVMINATYGRKMQPAMHAAARRRALIAPRRRRATSFISRAVSYFYETEFEIWACFGSAGLFRVLVFLVLFITTLSRVNFRLIKP